MALIHDKDCVFANNSQHDIYCSIMGCAIMRPVSSWGETIESDAYNVTKEAEPEPAFPSAARATMDKCSAVFAQREGEYKDTWALENQVTTMLDHVLKVIGMDGICKEEKRLILVAALCDVKDSRMIGDYKEDSHLDAINYRMTLAKWLDDYVNPKDS